MPREEANEACDKAIIRAEEAWEIRDKAIEEAKETCEKAIAKAWETYKKAIAGKL